MSAPAQLPPATPLKPRRRAVIVGASSGIGAALAHRLAQEGYSLVLLARRADLLQEICADIAAKCGEQRAIFHVHDVSDHESVPALFQQVISELGGLDLFIYNAGLLLPVGLEEYDFDKDRRMLSANLLGAIAWLNPVAAMFSALGCGQIVAIGSVAGDRGRVGAPGYNTSKAGLHTYLEALRNRLSRRGVHVLTVKPGFVQTDMLKHSARTFMVITPQQAAEGIWRAVRARRQSVYVPGQWALLMLIIKHIPSVIFRRMSF